MVKACIDRNFPVERTSNEIILCLLQLWWNGRNMFAIKSVILQVVFVIVHRFHHMENLLFFLHMLSSKISHWEESHVVQSSLDNRRSFLSKWFTVASRQLPVSTTISTNILPCPLRLCFLFWCKIANYRGRIMTSWTWNPSENWCWLIKGQSWLQKCHKITQHGCLWQSICYISL